MRADRAICVGVDRASQKVLVQGPSIEDAAPIVSPMPYLNIPPWPLSFVQMLEVSSGSFVALGGIGDDEERLREDFDQFIDLAPGAVAGSAWEIVTSGAYVLSSSSVGYGTARFLTPASSNGYVGMRKDPVTLTAPPALWVEAKLSISTTSSRNFKVGLVDQSSNAWSTTNEVCMISESSISSGSVRLTCKSGGLSSAVDTGFIPTASTPFYVHFVVSGGAFAAAWIATEPLVDDEFTVQGPFIVELNVPSGSVGPGFSVQTTSSSAVSMDVDYVSVHTVWPVASPSDLVSAVVG